VFLGENFAIGDFPRVWGCCDQIWFGGIFSAHNQLCQILFKANRQGKSYNNLTIVTTKLFSTVPGVTFRVESISAWDIFVSCIDN